MHIEIKKIDIVFQNVCLLLFVYTNDFIADLCLDRKPRTNMFYDNSVSK